MSSPGGRLREDPQASPGPPQTQHGVLSHHLHTFLGCFSVLFKCPFECQHQLLNVVIREMCHVL